MDGRLLREEALAETSRFFHDQGYVPSEDSEEWEAEYRRQFDLAKRRAAMKLPPRPVAAAEAAPSDGPELSGLPAEKRWAAQLRAERLKLVPNGELRQWLLATWTAAKDWVGTRELATSAFQRRVAAQFAEHRKQAQQQRLAQEREHDVKAAAAAAARQRVLDAGITAAGLLELVDLSARVAVAGLRAKLAELHVGERNLRIFESDNPATLMVLETVAGRRSEYAIERDAGLAADLALWGAVETI